MSFFIKVLDLDANKIEINGKHITTSADNLFYNNVPQKVHYKTINNEQISTNDGNFNIEIENKTNHSDLDDLLTDNHVQYALTNGTRGNFQEVLISGVNIKTVNGESLLGSGNILIITDEAPSDGKYYGRKNGVWYELSTNDIITVPTFELLPPTNKHLTTATFNGKIIYHGEFNLNTTQYRFHYGTDSTNLNFVTNWTNVGLLNFNFSKNITGLDNATVYYIKLEIRDSYNVSYGTFESPILNTKTLGYITREYIWIQGDPDTNSSETIVETELQNSESIRYNVEVQIEEDNLYLGKCSGNYFLKEDLPANTELLHTTDNSSLESNKIISKTSIHPEEMPIIELRYNPDPEYVCSAKEPLEFKYYNNRRYSSSNDSLTATVDTLNFVQEGTIPFPFTINSSVRFRTNKRVYLIGGYINGKTWTQVCISASLNKDGTIDSWRYETPYPYYFGQGNFIVTDKKVFGLCGYAGSTNTYYADIDDETGELSEWKPSGVTFQTWCRLYGCVTYKNFVYILGGWVSSSINTIQRAEILVDGMLSSFKHLTTLPIVMSHHTAEIIGNRIWIFGFYHTNWDSTSQKIYTCTIDENGNLSPWVNAGSIGLLKASSTNFVYKNRIFLVGGYSNYTNLTVVDVDNVSGTVSSISNKGNLTGCGWDWSGQCGIVHKNKFFTIGGHFGGTSSNAIYSAVIPSEMSWDITTNDHSYETYKTIENQVYDYHELPGKNIYHDYSPENFTSWTNHGAVGPAALEISQSVVTSSRVYLISGHNGSSGFSFQCWTDLKPDGTIGTTWTTESIPFASWGHKLVRIKNKLYCILGSYGGGYYNIMYENSIDANGTIDSTKWTVHSTLPSSSQHSAAVFTTSKYLYVIGGHTNYKAIRFCEILNDGSLGPWQVSSKTTINNVYYPAVFVTSNRVYILNGHNGSVSTNLNEYAFINTDGTLSDFIPLSNLPISIHFGGYLQTKNRAYFFGGYTNTSTNVCYSSKISSDGSLGTWTQIGNLPAVQGYSSIAVTKSKIYLIGGRNSSAYTNMIQSHNFKGWEQGNDSTVKPFSSVSLQKPIDGYAKIYRKPLIQFSYTINNITSYSTPILIGSLFGNYLKFNSGNIVNNGNYFRVKVSNINEKTIKEIKVTTETIGEV